jgi:uncharacterized protein YpiB (UPF0302 family)
MFWLKLCKKLFSLEKDLYIGVTYISPANSSFSSKRDNIFEILESDIAKYSQYGNCLICGDFNARTATEPDYCLDENSNDYVSLPNDYVSDIPLKRNNLDIEKPDDHGKQLLTLCKTSGLRILNGRTVGDLLGHCTCYSHTGKPSVIDYMLTSAVCLKNVEYFHVNAPTNISIHAMLLVGIKTAQNYSQENTTKLESLPDKYIWNNMSETQYQKALATPEIQKQIHAFLDSSTSLQIDEAVEAVNSIIKNAADKAGIIKRRKSFPKKRKKNKKKWYDKDCKALFRELRKSATRVRNSPYDVALLQHFKTTRKNYKKIIRRKKHLFRKDILDKLDTLSTDDPKAFWSLYDDLTALDKNSKSIPISPDEWLKHFSKLMSNATSRIDPNFRNYMDDYIEQNSDKIFNELDFKILPSEINKATAKLKIGKACGPDQILNEMLKAGISTLNPILCKLFNFIFSHQQFPNIWRYNTLTPLHKSGDAKNPSNYRGIALTSNLCKLFCGVLHSRLNKYVQDNNLIPAHQLGYQAKTRTADHMLTLKRLVDKYINKCVKARFFTCFVDFRKAFDTISRIAFQYKLLKMGIGGRFLNILRNMYSSVFFSVKLAQGLTDTFPSSVGVKQGCVLSPILFNLFVSDLPTIFDQSCDPVSIHDVSLSCLMFEDDLVIMSQSANGLQSALDKLGAYCSKWGLEVNIDKTKILIFNKSGRLLNKYNFFIDNKPVTKTTSYKYLGIIFCASGTFSHAVEHLSEQAGKALFKLKQRHILNNSPTALKLFDTLIMPILRYGSEVWGPSYINKLNSNNFLELCEKCPIEKIHNKFCRYMF